LWTITLYLNNSGMLTGGKIQGENLRPMQGGVELLLLHLLLLLLVLPLGHGGGVVQGRGHPHGGGALVRLGVHGVHARQDGGNGILWPGGGGTPVHSHKLKS
jgi:hypothetical protein